MQDVIFREYDIRGKVGTELIIEDAYDLACAIAYFLVHKNPSVKTVAVAMDGRTHSPAICNEVTRALQDSGLNVLFVGMCPTPALYFALRMLPVQAGLMVTASHNPAEYNGMKVCLGTASVWGKDIQEIKHLFKDRQKVVTTTRGTYTEQLIIPRYVAWLADHFAHLKHMKLSAVVDCGNGAGGMVMPQLIQAMEWKHVQLLYQEVDGTYPNHEADPTIEKNMRDVKNILATTDTCVGIGLDGDCDRMAPMAKSGFLVPGDQLLALYAQAVVHEHPGAAVVFDVKVSSGVIELLEKMGAMPCMSPAGHSIIKEQMKLHHALLGGELSCHFFFADRYFGYDDAFYAMMRLFELLVQSGKSLDELLGAIPKKVSSPEYRVKCPEDKKVPIVAAVKDLFAKRDDAKLITIDGVRATLPYGWGLVRVSNTQPALTIRFESDSQQGLQQVKQDFYTALQPYFDNAAWLQEQLGL